MYLEPIFGQVVGYQAEYIVHYHVDSFLVIILEAQIDTWEENDLVHFANVLVHVWNESLEKLSLVLNFTILHENASVNETHALIMVLRKHLRVLVCDVHKKFVVRCHG